MSALRNNMPICLITNSDDFGMNSSITDAIIETHLKGIMTSTTIMVNMPGFEYAVKRAKETKTLGIGIHFNLTEGKPITLAEKVDLLLDQNGNFLSNKKQRKNLIMGKRTLDQAKLELKNQLSYLLDHGINPTHFDSHHHITGTPLGFKASLYAAKTNHLNRARITNIDLRFQKGKKEFLKYLPGILQSLPKSLLHFYNKSTLRRHGFFTPDTKIIPNRVVPRENDKIAHFLAVLAILQPGVTEISFHPGYENANPSDRDSTRQLRKTDFEIATSPIVREFLIERNIRLINFNDI
jgi:predicted glycoside hydrolase/deacetylase ChbG (UPF0249 family)